MTSPAASTLRARAARLLRLCACAPLAAAAGYALAAAILTWPFSARAAAVTSAAAFFAALAALKPGRRTGARALETFYPESDYRLLTLLDTRDTGSPRYADLLRDVDACLARRRIPWTRLPGIPGAARALYVSAAVALTLAAAFPDRAASRLWGVAVHTQIHLFPSSQKVEQGKDARVVVLANDIADVKLQVFDGVDGMRLAELQLEPAPGTTDGSYEGVIKNVRRDLRLVAHGLSSGRLVSSAPATLHVYVAPRLLPQQVVVVPPAYTGLDPDVFGAEQASVRVLPGSEARVSFKSNGPLERIDAQYAGNAAQVVRGPENFEVNARALSKGRLSVSGVSPEGLTSPVYTLDVETRADRPPRVAWTEPSQTQIDAPTDGLVPLRAQVDDDFGVSAAWLEVTGPDGGRETMPLPVRPSARQELAYLWTAKLPYPGSSMTARLHVLDNDDVLGPNAGVSEILRVNAPSVMDMFKRVSEEGGRVGQLMEQMSSETRRLLKSVTQASRSLQTDGKMAWQLERELVRAAEEQKQLKEQIRRDLVEMSKRAEQASKQKLLSRESIEKLQSLGEMMNKLFQESFQQYQDRLNQAIQQQSFTQKDMQMRAAQFDVEKFAQNIEQMHRVMSRVMEALEREEAVQAMQDLMKQTEEAMAKRDAGRMENLANAAQQVKDRLQNLARDPQFEDLKKTLAESARDLEEQYKDLAQDMKEGKDTEKQKEELKSKLEEMQQSLEKGMEKKEQKENQQSSAELEEAVMLAGFSIGEMEEARVYFQGVGRELNQLAEDLQAPYQKTLRRSQALLPLMSRARDLVRLSAERMILFDPQIDMRLAMAVEELRALPDHDEQPGKMAIDLSRSRESAVEASWRLLETIEAIKQDSQKQQGKKQGGGKSGGKSLSQMLREMIESQKQLNQRASQMQMQMFGMGRPMSLQDLAYQQQLIRQSIEQEGEKFSQLSEKIGRLDKMLGQMKDVENDLREKGVTEDVKEKQEKILNKMLELDRSLSEEDEKEEKFEAEPFFGAPTETSPLKLTLPAIDEARYLESLPPSLREAGRRYLKSIQRGKDVP